MTSNEQWEALLDCSINLQFALWAMSVSYKQRLIVIQDKMHDI